MWLILAHLASLAVPTLQTKEVQEPFPGTMVAVTRSGLAVECAVIPQPGDLRIQTPFGPLATPTDPVEKFENRDELLERLRRMRNSADSMVLAQWAKEAGDSGLLVELMDGATQIRERKHDLPVELFQALETWGERIDPVPVKVKVPQRVRWLWREILKEDGPRRILLGGRLVVDAQSSEQADRDRQLSIAELRQGLRHRHPWVRRVAARCAGKQQLFDAELAERLFFLSVEGVSPGEQDGAAWASAQIHAHDARQFWFLALARGPELVRLAASRNLAFHGGQPAVHGLILVLSGYDKKSSKRYRFAGRSVQVVKDVQMPVLRVSLGLSASNYDVLRDGSLFKVTRHSDEFTAALVEALTLWAGLEESERGPEEWLQWYLDHYSSDFH
ncbi:MAG: hypothetical protein DWQ01_00275 [Planctomycetota bacterium]|nr:MAG: hypothetical protein DWQ01_00275 [Planctomycetota bacterium]